MNPQQLDELRATVAESPRPLVERIDRLIFETRQTRYALIALAVLMMGCAVVLALWD